MNGRKERKEHTETQGKNMSAAPLIIIAILVAKDGCEAQLKAAQTRLVEATLKEEGCLRYELNQSLDDGRVLIFVESWTSEATWRAHMEGEAMRKFLATGAGDWIRERTLHQMARVA
jgi:quinol monooxygenase YgiN